MKEDELEKILEWFDDHEDFWMFQVFWGICTGMVTGILWLGENLISFVAALAIVIAPMILATVNAGVLALRTSSERRERRKIRKQERLKELEMELGLYD